MTRIEERFAFVEMPDGTFMHAEAVMEDEGAKLKGRAVLEAELVEVLTRFRSTGTDDEALKAVLEIIGRVFRVDFKAQ